MPAREARGAPSSDGRKAADREEAAGVLAEDEESDLPPARTTVCRRERRNMIFLRLVLLENLEFFREFFKAFFSLPIRVQILTH